MTCAECIRRYFVSFNSAVPTCMNCHVVYNRVTLMSMVGVSWIKGTYRAHLADLDYKALSTSDMSQILNEREAVRMLAETKEYYTKINILVYGIEKIDISFYNRNRSFVYPFGIMKEIYEYFVQSPPPLPTFSLSIGRSAMSMLDLADNIYAVYRSAQHRYNHRRDPAVHMVPRDNICRIKCPLNECRGFLSNLANGRVVGDALNVKQCTLCRGCVCVACMQETVDEHKCSQDDVDTIALIRKDSKPCPKCGTYISKIAGCDQMFCMQCFSAYNWRTLKPITGFFHNPHYFDALDKGLVSRPNIGRNDQERAINEQDMKFQLAGTPDFNPMHLEILDTVPRIDERKRLRAIQINYLDGCDEKKIKKRLTLYRTSMEAAREHRALMEAMLVTLSSMSTLRNHRYHPSMRDIILEYIDLLTRAMKSYGCCSARRTINLLREIADDMLDYAARNPHLVDRE
jgi:hypothetical protein